MEERTRDALRRALRARAPDSDPGAAEDALARAARLLERAGGRARSIDDPDYPSRLRTLPRPPDVVYLAGPWHDPGPVVALVGSRHATGDGLDVARAMASDLAARGVAVVSGLAQGIDAAAHEGALDAGGWSGAVLGTGLHECYPRGHESLQAALGRSLGLLSEVMPGDPPRRATFAARNRLLAAVADAVVLVQGASSSGALLTVEAAASLRRPIGAMPWDSRDPLAAAPHDLIRSGRATLVRHAGDVVSLLGERGDSRPATPPRASGGAASRRATAPIAPLAPASRVLASLRQRAEAIDDVAARAGLPIAETAAALVALELEGLARREPGGRFRLARRG